MSASGARPGAGAIHTSYVRFDERADRPRFLASLYGPLLRASVLDVGCDRAVLRELSGSDGYVGIDLSEAADVRVDLQAEGHLPFPDRSFETVVCSDVLEHLDNLHRVFDELVRVARAHLLVTLPNNWNSARVRLRRGQGAIAHYGLPLEAPADRHRWFFNLSEAAAFFRGQALRHRLAIEELRSLEKPRAALVRAARHLRFPGRERYRNLYAHTLICLYRRP